VSLNKTVSEKAPDIGPVEMHMNVLVRAEEVAYLGNNIYRLQFRGAAVSEKTAKRFAACSPT